MVVHICAAAVRSDKATPQSSLRTVSLTLARRFVSAYHYLIFSSCLIKQGDPPSIVMEAAAPVSVAICCGAHLVQPLLPL